MVMINATFFMVCFLVGPFKKLKVDFYQMNNIKKIFQKYNFNQTFYNV